MGGRSQSLFELTKHLVQFLGLRGKELMHAPVVLPLVAIPAGGDEVGNAVRSATALGSTLRILSSVSERGCNSMAQGSRKFLDISVGGG